MKNKNVHFFCRASEGTVLPFYNLTDSTSQSSLYVPAQPNSLNAAPPAPGTWCTNNCRNLEALFACFVLCV